MKTASGLYEHFGDRDIELATFEHDITLTGWAEKYRIGELDLGPIFWAPIATLTPPRLADGKGASTNLIQPSVVITDTTGTPYAGFDMRDTPARAPAVSVGFTPSKYGITTPATYVFTFFVETSASITLRSSGLTLPGATPSGVGSVTFTGARAITVIYRNLAASQPVWAAIQQESGGQWAWYRATVGYPPLVITSP